MSKKDPSFTDPLFLSALLDTEKGMHQIFEQKLNEEFLVPEMRPVFKYIREFYQAHGQTPTMETVEKHFPKFYKKPKEPLSFYIQELKDREKYRIARSLSHSISNLFSGESGEHHLEFTRKAEEMIFKAARKLAIDLGTATTADIVKHIPQMKQRYEYEELHGFSGVPTPWAPLTLEGGGWRPGHLNLIAADTKVGKTWAMIMCAIKAYDSGFKPLIFTEEMEKEEIMERIFAVRFKVPYGPLTKRKLDHVQKQYYFDMLDEFGAMGYEFVVNHGAGEGGFDAIEAFSDQINPDLILIDGLDLYAKGYGWEEMAQMMKLAKRFAMKTSKPVIATAQVAANGQLAFGKAYPRNANNVIKMTPIPDAGLMLFDLIYTRAMQNIRWCTRWDHDTMDYEVESDLDPDAIIEV